MADARRAAPPPSDASRLLVQALQSVLSRVAEPTHVLRTILDVAVAETGAERGALVEVGPNGERDIRVLHRFEPQKLNGIAGSYSQSIFSEVLASGETILIEDALSDPRFSDRRSVMKLRLVSVLCTPIRAGERITALVYLENHRERHFVATHVELLRSLVEIAGPVLSVLQSGTALAREHDLLQFTATSLDSEARDSRALLAREWSFGRFVGRSLVVRALEAEVAKASATDFPVLLLGESGTGKNVLARILHHAGPRAKGPFIMVFCPSLQGAMFESTLFGHKRGAFTGADTDRIGKVQAAEGGTLFLDEIGELNPEAQAKLLRLVQDRAYEQVGDPQERQADVRVIAASNRDLQAEVGAGRFRRDLFERLNYVPVRLPALRERREDIVPILRHCLDQQPNGRWIDVDPEACDQLAALDFSWPGNVRHLEQLAVRLALAAPSQPASWEVVLRLLGSPGAVSADTAAPSRALEPPVGGPADDLGLPAVLQRAEEEWLRNAIDRNPGLTRAQLAARLGISESSLYKKLRAYGLSS